ncbi:MAG TPA: CDP-alcohol phosphatidyltransferase family protein [Rhodothermales bacterium]
MKFVPNALTITRIVLTPLVLWLLSSGTFVAHVWALVLFVIAATSDYLDGRLARSLGAGSRLGQFLDPLADKILVIGTFSVLAFKIPHVVPWWAVIVIFLRDVALTLMRSWAESRGRSLRTLGAARVKTAVQLTFLIAMMVLLIGTELPGSVGRVSSWIMDSGIPYAILILVVIVTVATGLMYVIRQDYSSAISSDDRSRDVA